MTTIQYYKSIDIKSITFDSGLVLAVGEQDPFDDGTITEITQHESGYYYCGMTDRGEGYSYAVDLNGEVCDEDEIGEEKTVA